MFNFYKFSIGDYVRVRSVLKMKNSNTATFPNKCFRRAEFHLKPFDTVGQIVGIKQFQTGEIETCHDECECSSWLNVDSTFYCWMIRLGLKNKPIFAFPESIELLPPELIKEIPVLHTIQPPWNDNNRRVQSEEAKNAPRNLRGQFIKSFGGN